MITISAFGDEIDPDLGIQIDVCRSHGIRHMDVRGVGGVNCSKFTLQQTKEYRRQIEAAGMSVSCLGSPIGKRKMDDDFNAHLELARHCCQIADAFGTRLIRVFSFYPSAGKTIQQEREAVLDRMAALVRIAESANMVLLHENEKGIYGATPDRVKDLFQQIDSPHFKGIFDPANYVEEDAAPYDEGWTKGLDKLTEYFHIKDKKRGEKGCLPAGHGEAQIPELFADLKARNWSGVMALEPHLAMAGQFSGFSGRELFDSAANALKEQLDAAALPYA